MKKVSVFCFILSFLAVVYELKAAELPLCDNEKLAEIVFDQLKEVSKSGEINSPLNIRTSELVLKYTKALKEMEVEKFDPKEEYAISDKIMELKINKSMSLEKMRLCKGQYEGTDNRIYALLYEKSDSVQVFIVTILAGKQQEKEIVIEN